MSCAKNCSRRTTAFKIEMMNTLHATRQLLALLGAMMLAGTAAAAGVTGTYLAFPEGAVFAVEVVQTGNKLTGRLETVAMQPAGEMSDIVTKFGAVLDGVHFSGQLVATTGRRLPISGDIDGKSMRLAMASSTSATFVRGMRGDFDAAVENMSRRADEIRRTAIMEALSGRPATDDENGGQKGCARKLRASYLAYLAAISSGTSYKQYFAPDRMSSQHIADLQRQVQGAGEKPVFETCDAIGNDREARSVVVFEAAKTQAERGLPYVYVSGSHGLIGRISLEKRLHEN
ncbi:MAG: hypothetical protein JO370_12065 [Paucibacter sp.]|nr:hypothetical protein [Roseateles sp.]